MVQATEHWTLPGPTPSLALFKEKRVQVERHPSFLQSFERALLASGEKLCIPF